MGEDNTQSGFLQVCYYSWKGLDLLPHEIDTSLCTHLILAFVEVKDNVIYKGSTSGEEAYHSVAELKNVNPALKVMISVGGGGNAAGFHHMVTSASGIDMFIESVISTLREHKLDGIDIDWEFPNMIRHGKRHFTRLIQKLNAAFQDEAFRTGKDKLLLSAAVAPQSMITRNSYNVPEISRCVDFINLMTYDLHLYKWYFPFSGHNAPLYPRRREIGYFSTLNMKRSAEFWFSKGCPKSKLIIGIPTYGLSWKLGFSRLSGVFCPTLGRGPTGGGYVSYPEVKQFIENGAKRVFDKQSCVPYACNGKIWVSYDDLESVEAKTRWILSENYGGVMTFNLNCDDCKGATTGGLTFPLHRKIKEIIESTRPS